MATRMRKSETYEARLMAASDWLQRIDREDVPDRPLQEWLKWCGESDENRKAFDEVQVLYQQLREAPEEYRDALRRLADDNTKPGIGRAWLALAASIVLVVGATLLWWQWQAGPRDVTQTFETSRGEHRNVVLADGSELTLGADSALTVDYGEHERLLNVRRGEVYFRVRHEAARPFIVQAGVVRVVAVGTAFNVQRGKDDRVTVAVTEGVVDVSRTTPMPGEAQGRGELADLGTVRVTAGQRTVIKSSAEPPEIRAVNPAIAVSWQEGRLQFVNEPLSVVIESVNRYARGEVVINNPEVGNLTYTGTVLREHADEWVVNLPQIFPVRTIPLEDGGVVLVTDAR